MDRCLDKLKSMIMQSSLSSDEQRDFIGALSQADDAVLQPIMDLCAEHEEWIERLYKNYKTKKSAQVAQDIKSWENILETEGRMLKDTET